VLGEYNDEKKKFNGHDVSCEKRFGCDTSQAPKCLLMQYKEGRHGKQRRSETRNGGKGKG
jgi:hypothetical protein